MPGALKPCLVALALAATALLGPPALADGAPPLDATLHLVGDALSPDLGSSGVVCLAGSALSDTYTSAPHAAPFGFTVALPSWNAHAPLGTGLRFALRTHDVATGAWSPWLMVGEWGPVVPAETDLATESAGAKVDVDTLLLKAPADAYQWRVTMTRTRATIASPTLRRLSVCLTGDSTTPEARRWQETHPVPALTRGARLEIPAPFRGQLTTDTALTGRICSPCTVASALGAYGVDVPTETVAGLLYDPRHAMFGVWPRATQGASELGVDGYVTRIRSYGELRRQFELGRVVGASIRFKPGTLKHPPYPSTAGHLILLRGLTEAGDVITDDSYRAADGDGKVWDRDDLAIAWLATGGVAYVFDRGTESSTVAAVRYRDPRHPLYSDKFEFRTGRYLPLDDGPAGDVSFFYDGATFFVTVNQSGGAQRAIARETDPTRFTGGPFSLRASDSFLVRTETATFRLAIEELATGSLSLTPAGGSGEGHVRFSYRDVR